MSPIVTLCLVSGILMLIPIMHIYMNYRLMHKAPIETELQYINKIIKNIWK